MATDQEIRDAGFKYIPQQKYLQNPFELPTAPEAPVVNQGIVNTNAFTNGGNNNIGGNLFGYGTAVPPGDKSVITSGPYAGQSGYYNSINYTGGLPGNVTQKGPGRYFQYDNSGNFYKDYSIQPKKELPSWMKMGLAVLPGGRFLGNYIENKMNPLGPMTQEDIDKSQGGSYGIAGLSDTQKQYYDALASQGFLYDGPGGMKTLDGKNFSQVNEDTINDYFQGKIDKFGSIEEYEDYLNEGGIKKDPRNVKNLQLILNQYKTLKGINEFNTEKQYQNQIKEEAATAATAQAANPEVYKSAQEQGFTNDQGGFSTSAADKAGTSEGSGQFSSKSSRGRKGYFYGGRVNYKKGGRGRTDAESQYGADSVGSYDSSANQSDRGQSYGINNNPPVSTGDNNKIVTTDFINTNPSLTFDYTDPKNYASLYGKIGLNNILDNDDINVDGTLSGEIGPIGYNTNFTDQGIGPTTLSYNDITALIDQNKNLQNIQYNKGPVSVGYGADGNITFNVGTTFKNGGLASIL